jgi:hypothetical protein
MRPELLPVPPLSLICTVKMKLTVIAGNLVEKETLLKMVVKGKYWRCSQVFQIIKLMR